MRLIKAAALGALLMLSYSAHLSDAQSRIIPFSEIQPGMEGFGKTVIKGNEIQTFSVKVINVIDNPGILDDHIVVRVSGLTIRQAGGIAAGMSGSPIYINNKLAGALWGSWGFQVGADPIALVRPIETMLALVDPLKEKAQKRLGSAPDIPYGVIGSVEIDGRRKQIELVSHMPSPSEQAARPETVFIEAAATPLLVSGLTGRALQYLKAGISEGKVRAAGMRQALLSISREDFIQELSQGLEERYGLRVLPTGFSGGAAYASAYTNEPLELQEGSPFGVMLTDGDFTAGAFGTVSYIEENILLGFGHWFLPAGETEFFLTDAYILDTVESLEMPFKLGVPGKTIGTILEDRWQGVGGITALEPRVLAVSLTVKDRDLAITNGVRFRIAYYESLIPLLFLVGALDAVDRTLNRIGPGTMITRYTLEADELSEPFVRTDVFASLSDIAVTGPLRVAQTLFLLTRNEFRDLGLNQLDIAIEVQRAVKSLRVKALKTERESYEPGETVRYTVTLQAYRGEEQTIEGELRLPKELDQPSVTLLAFGGPRRSDRDEAPEFDSLDDLIDFLQKMPTNNSLIVELVNISNTSEDPPTSEDNESEYRTIQTINETFVYGEKTLEIKIKTEKPQEPEPEKPEDPKPEKKPCKFPFYCP
ncbi:MAG: hypothetical protein NZ930_07170 [Candidatus Bipolaricaulota bacterium]|nr:hypothetical protein [Candidatus Bipolaricaulota bacterium]MDW8031820.1 SpoIVB peptidase S55 domain-containing protein [Candidatus Bipolaricaulota bacterium]